MPRGRRRQHGEEGEAAEVQIGLAGTHIMFNNLRCKRHPGANAKRILDGVDPKMTQVRVEDFDEFEGILEAGGTTTYCGGELSALIFL